METSTVGNVDAYAFQDLTQTSGTVVSVTVTAVARFYAGKSCRFFPDLCGGLLSLQVNGYSGSAQGLSGGYQAISQTWTTNPATGQAWTISQVNALQAGVHLDDIGNISRVTQVYVSVVIADRTTYLYANGATGMDTLTSLSLNGGAATTFGYDANGNLLSKLGSSKTCYAWNPENLMTQVKSVSSACTDTGTQIQAYSYDGLERRVKVDGTSSSTWTVSIYSGIDHFVRDTVLPLGPPRLHARDPRFEPDHGLLDGLRAVRQTIRAEWDGGVQVHIGEARRSDGLGIPSGKAVRSRPR